jgi:hypothetical protein
MTSTFVVLALAILLLVSGRIRPDLVALLSLLALLPIDIVNAQQGLGPFALWALHHPAAHLPHTSDRELLEHGFRSTDRHVTEVTAPPWARRPSPSECSRAGYHRHGAMRNGVLS